jgi:hypothetical protein
MKVKVFTVSILLALSFCGVAQTQFKVIENFHSSLPDSLTAQIIGSLDKLLVSIDGEQLDTTLIDNKNADLNRNFFRYLKGIEQQDTVQKYFQGHLINLYPIENKQFLLTLAYTKDDEIGRIFTFLSKENDGKIVFACPVQYNTKYWKTTTVGTITYFFPDTIDTGRAEVFNRKNISMAQKFGLPVRNWDVYMCRNYQETLQIQGCLYECTRNGYLNSGDIIDPKTLFSCMNDEDFSHDVLHIYASQIRKKERNPVAECGVAYYWGNAYHAGIVGKAPELKELVPLLQQYVQAHRDVKLLELFEKSPNVLAEYGYPWPVHVNRIISGIICREIEKQKGVEGIIELINCGSGYDNYFKSVENLIGINRQNFDKEVYKLIFE